MDCPRFEYAPPIPACADRLCSAAGRGTSAAIGEGGGRRRALGAGGMSVETALPERQAEATQDGHPTSFWALALGSIGVVYGDIGTSPIYAFREAVHAGSQAQGVTRDVVISVLSLIIWAL